MQVTMFDQLKKQKKMLLLYSLQKNKPEKVKVDEIADEIIQKQPQSFIKLLSTHVPATCINKISYPQSNHCKQIPQNFSFLCQMFKNKWKSISIQLQFFLREVQKKEDFQLQNKIYQIRQKIKHFNSYVYKIQIYPQQMLQKTEKQNIKNQRLNIQIKQKSKKQLLHFQEEYKIEISHLKKQNEKMVREIKLMTKKNAKLHQQLQLKKQSAIIFPIQNKNQQNIRLNNLLKIMQTQMNKIKQSSFEIIKQNQNLHQGIQKYKNQLKTLQNNFCEQNLLIKNQKQQFYVKQIKELKQTNEQKINNLNKQFKQKQQKLIDDINKRDFTIKKLINVIEKHVQENNTLEQNKILLQNALKKFKRQSQCLSADMHRINQQLKQNWKALKNVKIIAQKLNIFYKFIYFYEQIGFNDNLFD